MSSERLERGKKILNELKEGGAESVLKSYASIAPEMGNYILEFIFGDLYSRPGLDLKMKQIITITSLAVLGNAKPQLAYHIENGLNIGIKREEIVNIFIHIAGYAGFPAALNAITTAKEIFAKRDGEGTEN